MSPPWAAGPFSRCAGTAAAGGAFDLGLPGGEHTQLPLDVFAAALSTDQIIRIVHGRRKEFELLTATKATVFVNGHGSPSQHRESMTHSNGDKYRSGMELTQGNAYRRRRLGLKRPPRLRTRPLVGEAATGADNPAEPAPAATGAENVVRGPEAGPRT